MTTCRLLLVTVVGTDVGYPGLSAAVQIHDGVLSWQPVEWHGRTHYTIRSGNSSSGRDHGGSKSVYCFTSQRMIVRPHRGVGGGGRRSGQIGLNILLQWVHYSIRILFWVEYDV